MHQTRERLTTPVAQHGNATWRSKCHVGAVWLFAFATSTMRYTGWRPIYLGVFIGAWFYFLFGEKSRRESIRYWRHLRPESSYVDQWRWYYQHLVRWGRNLLDRQLFYHADFSYSGEGLGPLQHALARGQGCILLSAHIGNWEISAARLNTISKGKTAIVRVIDDTPGVRRLIEQHMADEHPEQIDPRDFMAASLRIRSALDKGHLVCMLGDRQLSGQAAIPIPFLGEPANFSSGPFLVAGLTGAPIFVGFFMKRGRRHYHVEVDPPLWIKLPHKGPQREDALRTSVEQWAKRLEEAVRKHPIQWHNFLNFWEK